MNFFISVIKDGNPQPHVNSATTPTLIFFLDLKQHQFYPNWNFRSSLPRSKSQVLYEISCDGGSEFGKISSAIRNFLLPSPFSMLRPVQRRRFRVSPGRSEGSVWSEFHRSVGWKQSSISVSILHRDEAGRTGGEVWPVWWIRYFLFLSLSGFRIWFESESGSRSIWVWAWVWISQFGPDVYIHQCTKDHLLK